MKTMDDDMIDLTVTSPPYDTLRDYTGTSWTFEKFSRLADELYRVTTAGGVVVWNVADETINGSETGSSFRQVLRFMECGFLLADTMIYKKANPGGARGSNKTYLQCFEYMFVLSKGPLRTFNLLKDRANKRPGPQQGGGKRRKDGEIGPTIAYTAEDQGRRLNIWEYPTQTDRFSGRHPAPFPLALAEDHVLSWSNPEEVVFDPFMGSGTTLAAALLHDRRGVGVEISEDYVRLANERLAWIARDRETLDLFAFA